LIGAFVLYISANAQYDSRKFTYDESNKNYINYDQLEELTNKFLMNEKSMVNEELVRQQIYIDRSQLPNFNDEEMHKKILAIPSTIPLKFHPEVGQLIRYFLFDRREYMTRMLTLSKTYFPIFEEVLDEKDLPDELKYLSIVESALNPTAKSRVGATGLWQFMHGTAKHEGMEINSLVDERNDIYKSTEHAAVYLKKLYGIYGDWLLALAAYNSGPGNVNKAIKNSGGYDFWTIKHKLPKETQNYVPSFIAIVYAMHYAKEYKLLPGKHILNFQTTTNEKIYEKQSLKYIAELLGTSEEYLKQYNPALKKGIVPKIDYGYNLSIPKEYAQSFQSKKHLLNLDPYIYNPMYVPPVTNEEAVFLAGNEFTKSDDNSTSNEINYNTTKVTSPTNTYTKEASTFVSKKDPNTYASTPITSASTQSSNTVTSLSDYKIVKVTEYTKKTIHHTVKKGENLTEIADRYNVSLKDIRDWNDLNAKSNLFVGKKLKIEQNEKVVKPQYVSNSNQNTTTASSNTSNDKVIIHKLKKGETLIQLSRKYGCSISDIKEWNNLTIDEVQVGQELFVYVENNPRSSEIISYSYYEAKSGDTLQTASTRFNVPIEVLKSLNNKEEDEPLKKGEKIKIPSL